MKNIFTFMLSQNMVQQELPIAIASFKLKVLLVFMAPEIGSNSNLSDAKQKEKLRTSLERSLISIYHSHVACGIDPDASYYLLANDLH